MGEVFAALVDFFLGHALGLEFELEFLVEVFEFVAEAGVLGVGFEVEVGAVGDAFEFAEAGVGEGEFVFDVGGAGTGLWRSGRVRPCRARGAGGWRTVRPMDCHQAKRESRQNLYHSLAVSGRMKNSISICSNSRERKVKLRGVTSLRKALPCWAMPKGTLTREVSTTLRKLAKMPWAVSGRR